MAIKVKKKNPEVTKHAPIAPVEVLAPEVFAAATLKGEEGYKVSSASKGSWLEDNPKQVLGGFVAIIAVVMGIYGVFDLMEGNMVAASADLTPAFDSYNTLVKGSPELDAVEKNPDIQAPTTVFETETEKWQNVYDAATKTMSAQAGSEIARTARITKAAAALRLGKDDEALELYTAALSEKSVDDLDRVTLLQGLATAYTAKADYAKALETFDKLGALNEAYAKALKYDKALLLEQAGKVDDAKTLYHEIIESDPTHPKKSDIERRLATL